MSDPLLLFKKLQPVFLDTSCFIYTIEENPKYSSITKQVLNMITDHKILAHTSVITLGEVLIKPMKNQNYLLASIYKSILTQTENLKTFPIDIDLTILASKIASDLNIQLFDSFQLAVAKQTRCKSFLTNDKQLKKFTELEVVTLDELV